MPKLKNKTGTLEKFFDQQPEGPNLTLFLQPQKLLSASFNKT